MKQAGCCTLLFLFAEENRAIVAQFKNRAAAIRRPCIKKEVRLCFCNFSGFVGVVSSSTPTTACFVLMGPYFKNSTEKHRKTLKNRKKFADFTKKIIKNTFIFLIYIV